MPRPPIREAQLDAALDEVVRLDLDGLRRRWQALYGSPAPPSFRARLLQAALAYKQQEQVYGGLKPGTRRELRRAAQAAERSRRERSRGHHLAGKIVAGAGTGQRCAAETGAGLRTAAEPGAGGRGAGSDCVRSSVLPQHAPSHIKPGTRLLRTWQGTTHEVLIGDTGVIYRGQQHRSLSEVARIITGQRWSGPLFFGLKRRAQGAAV